jgi:polysaccharide biosynthesis protein PslG
LHKDTARRGETPPELGATRADSSVDVAVGDGLYETAQLPPDPAPSRVGGNGTAANLTAPLPGDDSPNTLVLAGIPVPRSEVTAELVQRAHQRNLRLVWLGILLSLALLALTFVQMSPLTDPVAGQPPRTPLPIALAEVQPYGVNTFLHKEVDVWKKDKTLSMAREMGAGWIKQQFPWAEIEFRENPNDPFWDVKNNQSAWGKFDRIVDLADKHGLRVIARIDTVPAWARPTDSALLQKLAAQGLDPAKSPPLGPRMRDFSAFIDTFVRRYRGRIAAIQVWNEPNLKGEWATGNTVNPAEYVQLLEAAYSSAKTADPNIIVLAAPLATNNETLAYAGNLNEVDYLQGMYDAGAASYFDAMAANAYGTTFAPEDPPSRERLNFRRVELVREVMVRNGDEDKAVWFNEYGWNASPADMPQDKLRWGRVSEEEQGQYIVRGINYARENWSWAGVFTIWYMRQVGDIPRTDSEYFFGLVNPEFVVSPAYKQIQAAVGGGMAATPGEWGPISEPVGAGPAWQFRLPDGEGGASYIVPTNAGSDLTVPFVGTGLKLRLVPLSGSGAAPGVPTERYYVEVDGGSARVDQSLPRDKQGRAYVETSAGQPTEVTIASGLGEQFATGRHTARIWVGTPEIGDESGLEGSSGGGSRIYAPRRQSIGLPGIQSVVVEASRSYVLFGVLTAALLLSLAGLLFLLRKLRTV